MRSRTVSIILGLLVVSLLSCSLDNPSDITGITVHHGSLSQSIMNPYSQQNFHDELWVVQSKTNEEHDANLALYLDDQLTLQELTSRTQILEDIEKSESDAIYETYKAKKGIWSSPDVYFGIDCKNPISINVVFEIDVLFHGGSKGTLEGYPEPLKKNQQYDEIVRINTFDYIDEITAVRVVEK